MKNSRSEILYDILKDYCSSANVRGFKNTLEVSEEVMDVFFENNILFKLAISEEEPDMLKAIIDYYETQVITHLNDYTQEVLAKQKLTHAIEEAVDSTSSISDKVQEVVSKYSSHTDGEDYLHDLDDVELVYDDHVTTDSQEKATQLTEDNLMIMLGGDSPYANEYLPMH